MKILQTAILKIVIPGLTFFSLNLVYSQNQKINTADSLFRAKQYTQSIELYQSVFVDKKYSPAMLLKMAFIQEGLGKIGPTLYYLKLYYLATNDEQALQKMEELAAKFKLSGYSLSDADRLQRWIGKNMTLIRLGIAGIILASLLLFYAQLRKEKKTWATAIVMFLTLTTLVYFNNFYRYNSVIVNNVHTYLMEGPSAGSKVLAIIDEGNQLESLGQEDVWVKVRWMDKVAFVKQNSLLTIML